MIAGKRVGLQLDSISDCSRKDGLASQPGFCRNFVMYGCSACLINYWVVALLVFLSTVGGRRVLL